MGVIKLLTCENGKWLNAHDGSFGAWSPENTEETINELNLGRKVFSFFVDEEKVVAYGNTDNLTTHYTHYIENNKHYKFTRVRRIDHTKGEHKMISVTLTSLLESYDSWYTQHCAKFFLLKISGVGEKAEWIVNPRENFESKMEYIKGAYNEDLTLKANTNIKIEFYDFVESIGEVL